MLKKIPASRTVVGPEGLFLQSKNNGTKWSHEWPSLNAASPKKNHTKKSHH